MDISARTLLQIRAWLWFKHIAPSDLGQVVLGWALPSPLLFISDLTGRATSIPAQSSKPATFLTECRGEVHRTGNKTFVHNPPPPPKKNLAPTSSQWATAMKTLQVLVVGTTQTIFPGKESEFNGTGSILDKPNWFADHPERVHVSLCVRSTVCYLLRSSSSWSWYSVNSLWNRRFSPTTGKTSRSRSRFRRPWRQTKDRIWFIKQQTAKISCTGAYCVFWALIQMWFSSHPIGWWHLVKDI